MTDPVFDDSIDYRDFMCLLIWGDDMIDSDELKNIRDAVEPHRVIGDVSDGTDERFAYEVWWNMDEPVGYTTSNGVAVCDNQNTTDLDSTYYDAMDYDYYY